MLLFRSLRVWSFVASPARFGAAACTCALALTFFASAQEPAPAQSDAAQQPALQGAPAPTTENQPAPQQPDVTPEAAQPAPASAPAVDQPSTPPAEKAPSAAQATTTKPDAGTRPNRGDWQANNNNNRTIQNNFYGYGGYHGG